MSLLGEELADEDARLEAEGLRLAAERRELEGAITLARRQRDLDDAEAKASLWPLGRPDLGPLRRLGKLTSGERWRRSGLRSSWPGATHLRSK